MNYKDEQIRFMEKKLNEMGFNHPPLHQLIRNIISNQKLKLCEDEWCKQNKVRGFNHYIQNPNCMYYLTQSREKE